MDSSAAVDPSFPRPLQRRTRGMVLRVYEVRVNGTRVEPGGFDTLQARPAAAHGPGRGWSAGPRHRAALLCVAPACPPQEGWQAGIVPHVSYEDECSAA
jgi:hypothetical protein